ncbi:unnamed protein product [Nippostrongylus brasiliensis]|uniref:Vesicle-associated membrane protein 8 (inferred by orthology to a human protein) n=1 Tax=Nippostrongylus brasiliensis TaxID=27835 RepID=A0A0N4XSY6_NIPBR|nr:unnamed protein product [Nippostrongylus brasiliensis]
MAESTQRPTQDDRISEMRKQVEDVKTSANFKLTAHRVQRKMCMMNAKWTVISVLVALVVIAVIILLILDACGVFSKK